MNEDGLGVGTLASLDFSPEASIDEEPTKASMRSGLASESRVEAPGVLKNSDCLRGKMPAPNHAPITESRL